MGRQARSGQRERVAHGASGVSARARAFAAQRRAAHVASARKAPVAQPTRTDAPVVLRDARAPVAPHSSVATGRAAPWTLEQYRWQILVALCGVVALVCSVDRAAMSVTIVPMSSEFLWDDSTKGLVSSAFFMGYTVTNLFGGLVATRFPPKTVLALGVAIWSACTIATPLAAASGNLNYLLLCRVVMGLGEGVTFPCIQNLVAANVPAQDKTRSLSFIYSGVQAGTIVSLLTAPFIIKQLSWPGVFFVFGSVGFLWLLLWQPLAYDKAHAPQQLLPGTSGRNAAAAAVGAAAEKSLALQVPWKALFTNKPFLAVLFAHAGWGFGHSICYAWLPNYYYTEFGLAVRDSAWLSALPWVFTVLMTNVGGLAFNHLVEERGVPRLQVRKGMQVVGSVVPAACMIWLGLASEHWLPSVSLTGAVGLMTMGLAMGGLTLTGFGSNHQDLTTRQTGILFGITNAASSAMGTMSTYATGRVLDATDSWGTVFEMVAVVYVASAALYCAWASTENQFDNVKESR